MLWVPVGILSWDNSHEFPEHMYKPMHKRTHINCAGKFCDHCMYDIGKCCLSELSEMSINQDLENFSYAPV